ncbi:MAG: cupredoxin family copper-binding protein [Terriglobia bacterium]
MRKHFAILGLVTLALVVMATASARPQVETTGKSASGEHTEVSIDNFSFGPATLTINAGTTVTWTNKDDVPHNVISDDKLFASPVLDTDESFSYTFTKPGTFGYYCSIHPKMTAKVTVK